VRSEVLKREAEAGSKEAGGEDTDMGVLDNIWGAKEHLNELWDFSGSLRAPPLNVIWTLCQLCQQQSSQEPDVNPTAPLLGLFRILLNLSNRT